jgi:hypothetical protein
MLFPTRAPRLVGTRWVCDCGAQLRFVNRGFHARDFLAGALITAVWLVVGFLTPLSGSYPRLYWFAGAFLVVGALALFGVGKHEVRMAEEESSSKSYV